ncbi:MAG: hypothetical protein RLZZ618_2756 [Pseudomonadota bacterium]|jgi:AraC-like DNA-binding protein
MQTALSTQRSDGTSLSARVGRLHTYRNGFLYAGPVFRTTTQRQSVIVCVALTDVGFSVQTKKETLSSIGAALLPPGFMHIHTGRSPVAALDVAPTAYPYRALARAASASTLVWSRTHFEPVLDELRAFKEGHLPASEVSALRRRFLELALELVPPVQPLDPRVREVMRLMREEPGRPITDLAREVDMSVDWLRHLFVTEAAIPLRKYEMTLRLQTAAAHIGSGASVTQSAANAGFSDLAHFSKIWKLHYGYGPRRAFAGNKVSIDATSLARFETTLPGVEMDPGPGLQSRQPETQTAAAEASEARVPIQSPS